MTIYHQAKPITIRGVEYASIREAAKDLGINSAAVSLALKYSRLDQLRPKYETGRWLDARNERTAELLGIRKVIRKVVDRNTISTYKHVGRNSYKKVSVPAISMIDGE